MLYTTMALNYLLGVIFPFLKLKKKKNQMSNNLDAPILNMLNEWNGH